MEGLSKRRNEMDELAMGIGYGVMCMFGVGAGTGLVALSVYGWSIIRKRCFGENVSL